MSTLAFAEARQILLDAPQTPGRLLNDYGVDLGDYFMIAYHDEDGEDLNGASIVSKTERRAVYDLDLYFKLQDAPVRAYVGNLPDWLVKNLAQA